MRHARLRLPFGQEVVVVPAHAVRRVAAAEAETLARAGLQRGGDEAQELRAIARHCVGGEPIDDERVVEIVSQLLGAGDLIVVELDDHAIASAAPDVPAPRRLAELVDPPPRRTEAPVTDEWHWNFVGTLEGASLDVSQDSRC